MTSVTGLAVKQKACGLNHKNYRGKAVGPKVQYAHR
jgi:hypothetical protein